jgi:hypothetical protein
MDIWDFFHLLEAVVNTFATMGLSAAGVEAIWDQAYNKKRSRRSLPSPACCGRLPVLAPAHRTNP